MRGAPLALVAAALSAACVSTPRQVTDAPTLLIRVEHRPDSTGSLMLWAVPAQGQRLRLGLLNAESSNLVRFDRVDPKVGYHFVAERPNGTSIASPAFTPGAVGAIRWDLTRNTITPVEAPRP